MIILISYPSGGFGNFIYHMLTEFSDSTYKPDNSDFKFDDLGTSHSTNKYTTAYFQDPEHYAIDLPSTNKDCLILCDNGINNDGYERINQVFKNDHAKIRICIDYNARPVVYKTCVEKAMLSDLLVENAENVRSNWADDRKENYAARENFTLFYHNWPFKWEGHNECINLNISDLIKYPIDTINYAITSIKGTVIHPIKLQEICKQWAENNKKYFQIMYDWESIECSLDNNIYLNIEYITDLHDQGYINYRLEKKYNIAIPVFDYRNWFTDSFQILEMVRKLKN